MDWVRDVFLFESPLTWIWSWICRHDMYHFPFQENSLCFLSRYLSQMLSSGSLDPTVPTNNNPTYEVLNADGISSGASIPLEILDKNQVCLLNNRSPFK